MNPAREWAMFGGASLALMGAGLAADARRHSADVAAWRHEWRQAVGAPASSAPEGRGLVAAYRAAGSLVFLTGLGFAAAGAAGRAPATLRAGPLGVRLIGACVAALGLGFGALKLRRGAVPGESILHEESRAPRLPDERAAELASWALCALWAAFGLRLLTGAPQ